MLNESKIATMIKEYGEGMPSYKAGVRRRRLAPFTLSLAGAAAIVVAAVALSPRAEANSFQMMVRALKGAKTMDAVVYVKRIDGNYQPEAHEWFSGSNWALDRFLSRPYLHRVIASTPSGLFTSHMGFGVTTVEPLTWDFTQGHTNILDWVIADNNVGVVDAPRTMKLVDSPPINGHKAYILRYDKRDDSGSHTVETIWVDAQTNLPIRCAVADKEPGSRQHESYTDYRFDVPVPQAVFEPRFHPVIDLAACEARLMDKWSRQPVAKGRNACVLDVQEARDGSLYLLYESGWAPVQVTGADGSTYVRAMNFHTGGVQSNSIAQAVKVDGKQVEGSVFVPANPAGEHPSSYNLVLRHADTDWNSVKVLPGEPEALSVRARACDKWPDYTFELVLSQAFLGTDVARPAAEAKALEASGDIDGALREYREAFETGKKYISSIAYRQLVPAEKMLRKAGRTAEADAVKAEIEAGRAADPNVEPTTPTP